MTFAVWARWEAWHSWSRLFDFGNGANTNNIGCANTGGSSSLTCFHYVAPS